MFPSLPHIFRKHKLSADVRVLLLLRKAMEKGLVNTLGDLYFVLKGLITNDPKEFGPYTAAFYEYFLSIEIKKGEMLESALVRSETFQDWKKNLLDEKDNGEMPDVKELVDRFLDEVHLSSFDIKKVLDGQEILNNDDPDEIDANPDQGTPPPNVQDKLADYRNISMEELKKRMVADTQSTKRQT